MFDTSFYDFIPEPYNKYFFLTPYFVIAFVVTTLLTPIIGYLATKYDITDKPALLRKTKWNKYDDPNRHIHSTSVPYLGGLAVMIPVLLLSIYKLDFNSELIALTLGLALLMFSGVIGDLFNMPGKYQLTFQLLAAALVAFSTVNFTSLNIPFVGLTDLATHVLRFSVAGIPQEFVFPGDLLLIFWIAFTINAVKAVGGSDALIEGNMLVTFLLLYVIGIRTGSEIATFVSFVMAASISAFTFFNFPPAKIFSGSAGKTCYGFAAITLAVINETKFATTLLLLFLPLLDYAFVLTKRIIVHRPRNPLALLRINDKNHLHHQLMKLNLTPKELLFIEVSITLLIGSVAVLTTGATLFFVVIISSVLLLLSLTLLHIFTNSQDRKQQKKLSEEESPESKYSY